MGKGIQRKIAYLEIEIFELQLRITHSELSNSNSKMLAEWQIQMQDLKDRLALYQLIADTKLAKLFYYTK